MNSQDGKHSQSPQSSKDRELPPKVASRLVRTRPAVAMLLVSTIFRVVYTAWAVLPYADGVAYDLLARGLVSSGTYGVGDSGAPKAPGYPFFLAGVYGVFGEHHAVLYAIQHAIDLCTAVLVLAIALEWGLSHRAALVAFGVALFNPFTLFFASCVLSETLSIFLVTFALLQALRLFAGHLRKFALFGATMSAVALVRPAFAAVAPAILLALWLSRRMSFASWMKGAVAAGFAFILVWAPWGARNAAHFHRIVPYHVGDDRPHAGYNTWCLTWVTNMLDVYGAFFTKPPVLPARAFDTPGEQATVESLLREQATLGPDVDPSDPRSVAIEARFTELAVGRKAREPITFWVVNPAKRATTLWFTREVTILAQANVRMDELRGAVRSRPVALALKLSLFVLMMLLPLSMLIGSVALFRMGKTTVLLPLAGGVAMTVIIEYLMLFRPWFLVVMEPRYVVEFFPALTPAAVVGGLVVLRLGRRLWSRIRGTTVPERAAETESVR